MAPKFGLVCVDRSADLLRLGDAVANVGLLGVGEVLAGDDRVEELRGDVQGSAMMGVNKKTQRDVRQEGPDCINPPAVLI